MDNKLLIILVLGSLFSCKGNKDTIKPSVASISESVYASGIVKSTDQYQAFAKVNGIIDKIFVSEGDSVRVGSPILAISSEAQKLSKENAEIAAQFSDFNTNQDKLNDAKAAIDLAKTKMLNDSSLYTRQKNLWQQQIGSKVELEQRQLAYDNSKALYTSAIVKYDDLKRQLSFASAQSKKNLQISKIQEGDYTVRSEIEGRVYELPKEKGEIVGTQTPVAVVGSAKQFILEMQVDENDITKVQIGQPVLITMDSYKGKVFEAKVSKLYPIMNERSKTFLVEATFVQQPDKLYPNVTFEANIVLQTKEKALLIPRNYMFNDSTVLKSDGKKVIVKTGLMDYQKVEILSGISENDELIMPKQ